MSAAATARPRARSRTLEIVGGRLGNGHSRWPQGFFERYARHMTHSQIVLVGIVVENTIAKPRKAGAPPPDQYEVTEKALAQKLGVDVRQVRNVLNELGEPSEENPHAVGLLPWSRSGRGIAIRSPRFEHVTRLRCKKARKWIRDEEQAPEESTSTEKDEAKPPKPVPAKLKCPLGAECPVTDLVKIEGAMTNAPAGGESGNVFPLCSSTNGHRKRKPISAIAALQSTVNPLLLEKLGRAMDDDLASQIAAKLGETPLDSFAALVKARAKRGFSSLGLLLRIAEDAAAAWKAAASLRNEQAKAIEAYNRALADEFAREYPYMRTLETARAALPGLGEIERDVVLKVYPELERHADTP